MTVAPMISPTLGALVLLVSGWRAIFLALAAAGVLLALLVGAGYAELIPARDPAALAPGRLARSYRRAVLHRVSFGHALLGALSFGCMFAYVSGSPFVFIGVLGLRPGWFGVLFAVASLGITAGSLLGGRLMARGAAPARLLAVALMGQAGCSVALLALALGGGFTVATAVPLLVLANVAVGVISPIAVHGAMEPFPEMAGVASAVRGFTQMLGGAAASALVAALFAGTPVAMPLVMSLFAGVSLAVWAAMLRGAAREARAA